MRTLSVCVMTIMAGCATTTPPPAQPVAVERPCLTSVTVGQGYRRSSGYGSTSWLVRDGKPLPDDPAAAMADDGAAADLATRAEHDKRTGIGAFLLGGVLLAPGVGLIGYGVDQSQTGSKAVGGTLTALAVGGLVTGAIFISRAETERRRAFEVYNADHQGGACTAERWARAEGHSRALVALVFALFLARVVATRLHAVAAHFHVAPAAAATLGHVEKEPSAAVV